MNKDVDYRENCRVLVFIKVFFKKVGEEVFMVLYLSLSYLFKEIMA